MGGEMSIDWKKVGAAGSVIGGIAVIHGRRTREWRYIHTFGVALGIVSTVVPLLTRIHRALQAPAAR
jgi:orotate phosphoribosyltransferase-like protein